MIKKVSLLFIFLPVFLLSGCLETRILDDITMVQIAGFDLGENEGTMEQTVAFPTYFEMGEEGELEVIVMGTEGQSPKEIREDLNTEWQRPLRYGQMRILVFGHLFAEQHGISDIVNSFYRDPRVGNQLHVAVMEGRAHDGIDTDLTGARERVGMYYANLINQAEEEEKIPATNLHSFIFDIHSDGRDAYLPFFTIHEETLKLNGLALFDGEYKVGHLGPDESFIFKIMNEGSRRGTHTFDIDKEGADATLHMSNIRTKQKYEEVSRDPVPHYEVRLDIKGNVEDYVGELALDDPNQLKAVEDSIEGQIKATGERLINYFIEQNIDPLGFGEQYRSRTRDWDPEEWKESIYPSLKAEVHVDVQLLEFGAMD